MFERQNSLNTLFDFLIHKKDHVRCADLYYIMTGSVPLNPSPRHLSAPRRFCNCEPKKTAGYPGGLDCRQTASVVYGTVEASQPDKGKRNVCMISAVPLPMTG